MAAGTSAPPPTACTTRAAMIQVRPSAMATSAEPPMKTSIAAV